MNGRRNFLRNISCASIAYSIGVPYLSGQQKKSSEKKVLEPYEKNPLRLGFVGCGLMGGQNMQRVLNLNQKITAFCDVDTGKYGFGNARKYAPDAQGFVDYNQMFEKMKGNVDALVISTPDHSHFSIAMAAIKAGYPIFLEKPMCHTIWQINELTNAAKKSGVVTQMGNLVHSGNGIRITKEWIAAGAIGTVKEIVAWTCRPLRGVNQRPGGFTQWPPAEPIPSTLDWDRWQDIALPETFTSKAVPLNWRRIFKYGSGSLGDIGCHIIDVPMYALDLGYPEKVTSRQRGGTKISVPLQDEVVYYFPTSNQKNPVKLSWYSGFCKPNKDGKFEDGYDKSFLPHLPEEFTSLGKGYESLSDDGMFIIGSEGVIYSPSMHLMGKPVLLPKQRWNQVKNDVKETEPRIKFGNHLLNFVEAVRGDIKKTTSNFEDMKALTEVVQLGNLTLQSNSDIIWDSKSMTCVGNPHATKYVNPPDRINRFPRFL